MEVASQLQEESGFSDEEVRARVERTLWVMLNTPPDPKNVRTKAAAKVRRKWSGRSTRTHNARVIKQFRKEGKSVDIPTVFGGENLDRDLFIAVHEAVPKSVDSRIRNDLCQDLLCAVLAGDLKRGDLPWAVKVFLREAKKFSPHSIEDFMGRWKSEGLTSEAWKGWSEPDALTFEEKVDALAEHWSTFPEPTRREPQMMPKHRLVLPVEKRADFERRIARHRQK
jgi:hypothetical protein